MEEKMIYQEKNIYGTFEVYSDRMEILYSFWGSFGKKKSYIIKYYDVNSISVDAAAAAKVIQLYIKLNNGEEHYFYVNKSQKEKWNEVVDYINTKKPKMSSKQKIEKEENEDTKEVLNNKVNDNTPNTNNNSTRLGCLVIIIIFAVIFIISLFNGGSGSSAEITMENEFKKGINGLISANQVDKVDCNVDEDDGNGRYLLYCSIAYYPMKNGAIDMTSKIDSGLHVIYKSNGGNYYRKYAYTGVDDLKRSSCWGQSSEKNLSC